MCEPQGGPGAGAPRPEASEIQMKKLDGKVVVVTGASRGIGAEIARLFAAEGGRVICAARTLREGDHQLAGALETTVADIRAGGGEAQAVTVNIAEPAECERLIGTTRDTYGPVDVLVNNAALTYYVPVKDYPLSRWMRSWAVNFHAPFVLSQLVLATEPLEKISGRVTYSQQILKEFGWITEARGRGVETRGSGYSEA